jgi:hypothetical protein
VSKNPFESIDQRGPGRPTGPAVTPETIGSGYDVKTLYLRASDERGFSKDYRVTVPKSWVPAIAKAVEAYGYEYTAALFRDAVFHRLVWLAQHADDPALRAQIQMVQLEEASKHAATERQTWERHIEASATAMAGMRDDPVGLVGELERLIRYSTGLREPYRAQAQRVIDAYQRIVLRDPS